MAEMHRRDKPKRARQREQAKKYRAIGRRKMIEAIRRHERETLRKEGNG